ncbi:hypothetical protein D3C78_1955420 [compost metagenome]
MIGNLLIRLGANNLPNAGPFQQSIFFFKQINLVLLEGGRYNFLKAVSIQVPLEGFG